MIEIEVTSSGFLSLEIDEDTRRDQYGNDQTKLIELLNETPVDYQAVGREMDVFISGMSTDYEMQVFSGEERKLQLYGTLW